MNLGTGQLGRVFYLLVRGARFFCAVRKNGELAMVNQERIKEAFAAIQENGIEASLETCRGLTERINSGLCEINTEAFTDSSSVVELQLALEEAAHAINH
jgi:hypothetical protein